VDLKINVKRKFKVNGVEYDSLDAMPPEVRQAVERATAAGGVHPDAGAEAHVVFNGRRYGSREEMPEAERSLYDAAVAALPEGTGALPEGAPAAAGSPDLTPRPIGPSPGRSTAIRILLFLGLIVLLWLGWMFMKGMR
jgi:hypothetical protein